ncbi:MAG: cupin domain-containing protein [Coprobacillaceae bacterium]
MKYIGDINQIPKEFIWEDVGLTTKEIGKFVGSEKIYVNLDIVSSQTYSTKYHSHSQQEEFFFIISGNGVLRLNNQEKKISAGNFIAKPSGKNIAHTFYNPNQEPLVILDIGTIESEDTCYYPDEDINVHKAANGVKHIYKSDTLLKDWTSEPNK